MILWSRMMMVLCGGGKLFVLAAVDGAEARRPCDGGGEDVLKGTWVRLLRSVTFAGCLWLFWCCCGRVSAMLDGLTDDLLLHVAQFLAVPDSLRLTVN